MSDPAPAAARRVDPRILLAAANNAAWCAAVCHAHGLTTHTDRQRWWSSRRTPPYYPDAVTLDPSTDETALLAGIDTSAGCSVKDSFATLDLAASGFQRYFAAEWIHRSAPDTIGTPAGWRGAVLQSAAELPEWLGIWGDDGAEIFVPALLEDPEVRLVHVSRDDETVGVAVLNRSVLNRSAGAVGISNLVCTQVPAVGVWQVAVSVAAAEFPGTDLVGYERGNDLTDAVAAGFSQVGELQVWGR